MIRINLLAVERQRAKRRASVQVGQKLIVACSLILVVAGLFIGWWYWSLNKTSAELDRDIARAAQETARLRTIIQQVQQHEQRKAQLEERVALIEQLRTGQSGPVHLLDEISRSVPDMLWLTDLKQDGSNVTIEGRCMTNTALSDFVGNLEGTGYFRRSVEILSSTVEAIPQPPGEVVRFAVRAQFAPPAR